MSTAAQIQDIVHRISSLPYEVPLVLLQCTSTYPTAIKDINLKCLRTLQKTYPSLITGFSCHSDNPLISIAAVAMGASVLELHITRDHNSKGGDHMASYELPALKELIINIRTVEVAFGDGVKRIIPQEKAILNKLGKSLCTTRVLQKGDILTRDMVCVKTDVYVGIQPLELEAFLGKTLLCDVAQDVCLEHAHFQLS